MCLDMKRMCVKFLFMKRMWVMCLDLKQMPVIKLERNETFVLWYAKRFCKSFEMWTLPW